ncbi:MAG: NAD(P)-binding domain-containing protein [Sandaracinaceae bacterium]|jgi:thioredoxin reductase (NADPH)|nr:NAD(P)-binding domain-containing protein [Sandaracinaceae bacterium]
MSVAILVFVIAVVAVGINFFLARKAHQSSASALETAQDILAMGDVTPPTLHPKIDLDRCIGSGACVAACPETEVIGLVSGKAKLINPLACIGHGACLEACPVEAITLVYGTESRGVELPEIGPTFETNQPGIYIAGELGGMGLIRNAVTQGRQAAANIVASGRRGNASAFDAIVVGAGPAGISATLELMRSGMNVELLEREVYGGTIAHYPRAKVIMTGTVVIPVYGTLKKKTMVREDLLDLWNDIRSQTKLPVKEGELVESITRGPDGFWHVRSTSGLRAAANVVLALGRRGAPKKLEVPGEDLGHVYYRLLEPSEFRGKHVVVVGGGNSAVESALLLASDGGCASVSLSYRRAELARVRKENKVQIERAIAERRVTALLPSEVKSIEAKRVVLSLDGKLGAIAADAVIVQIGGTSPTDLLATFGVRTVTKYGEY